MGNVLRVLKRDLLRLLKAPAALTVIVFLIVLPSLYTWLNVAGFWNPYDNTKNLRVCVVNEDAGTTIEGIGSLELGDQVVDELKSNDQLGWDFMDREQAMEEVRSGRAYAAFIIPNDFSSDVGTLLTDDFHQPELQYYVNEKSGAISPKITDTGATTLDEAINSMFVSTVSGIVAGQLNDSLDKAGADIDASKTNVAVQLAKVKGSISDARSTVSDLKSGASDLFQKATEAKEGLATTRDGVSKLSDQLDASAKLMKETQDALPSFSTSLGVTLDKSSVLTSSISTKTNEAVANTNDAIVGAGATVNEVVAAGKASVEQNKALIAILQSLVDSGALPDDQKATAQQAIDSLTAQNETLSQSVANAEALYGDLSAASGDIASATDKVDSAVQGSLDAADGYRDSLADTTFPAINGGVSDLATATSSLSGAVSNQLLLIDHTSAALDQLIEALGAASSAFDETDTLLAGFEGDLETAITDVESLGSSGALAKLFGDDGIDPEKIADFMLSPTELQTEKLYPVNAYGSAMAPLFMSISLWIGVFMLLVILRQEVDTEGVAGLTAAQAYLAKWLFLAPLTALQAIVCCTGNLVLGVEVASLPLFYLTAIFCSLTYLSVQYALSVLFQHIGKGVCIILIFVQIPGATGLYPIEMTPDFFQAIYPVFPFTYGINALRETIAGFFEYQWIACIGMLALFFLAFFLIGWRLRPYLTNVNRMFAKQIKQSGILNGEEVELPARRYRTKHLFTAISDRDEFREEVQQRIARFFDWYPRVKRALPFIIVIVPALTTGILMFFGVEKVILLTMWLIWLVAVLVGLVLLEYVRDRLEHELSLSDLDDDELRQMFLARDGAPSSKEAPASAPEGGLKR